MATCIMIASLCASMMLDASFHTDIAGMNIIGVMSLVAFIVAVVFVNLYEEKLTNRIDELEKKLSEKK